MSTQTVTVSFEEEQLSEIDRQLDQTGLSSRAELVTTAVREFLARRFLAELKERAGKQELSEAELARELKAIKKIRREIWERDYAHLLSGQYSKRN